MIEDIDLIATLEKLGDDNETSLMDHVVKLETHLDKFDCFTQTGIISIDTLRLRLH